MTDDQAPETASQVAAGDDKSPEEIRAEIDQTREELGATVEALAEKTDVKAQAKSRLSDLKNTAQAKKDAYAAKARESTPESAGAGAQQLTTRIQRKPLPFAVAAAFTLGLGVGWLRTRR